MPILNDEDVVLAIRSSTRFEPDADLIGLCQQVEEMVKEKIAIKYKDLRDAAVQAGASISLAKAIESMDAMLSANNE